MALFVPYAAPTTVASEYAEYAPAPSFVAPRFPLFGSAYQSFHHPQHQQHDPDQHKFHASRSYPMNPMNIAPVNPAPLYPFAPVRMGMSAARAVRAVSSAAPVWKHQRVVIFDWDDTLFPTSAWISTERKGSKLNESADLASLRRVGRAVYDLLAYYLKLFGAKNVRVVTNGTKSWVLKSLQQCSRRYRELCAENSENGEDEKDEKCADTDADADYWAAIFNSFESLDILVSSARDMHGQKFPQHGASWKMRTFKSIAKRHFNLFSSSDNNVYSMVSIGDSEDEFVASFETKRMLETQNLLNRNNNVVRLHRVKLKKHPRIEDILSQIAMLTVEAEALLHAEEPITIRCDPAPTDIGV